MIFLTVGISFKKFLCDGLAYNLYFFVVLHYCLSDCAFLHLMYVHLALSNWCENNWFMDFVSSAFIRCKKNVFVIIWGRIYTFQLIFLTWWLGFLCILFTWASPGTPCIVCYKMLFESIFLCERQRQKIISDNIVYYKSVKNIWTA